jgi:RND family efflux transporter MFP subunit
VVARRQATVSSQETGRIEQLLVQEGDRVIAGQILARLDRGVADIDFRLSDAQTDAAAASVAAIRAELQQARADFERLTQLHQKGFVSQAALDRAFTMEATLNAQLQQRIAAASVSRLGRERQAELAERYEVRAPFDGVITSRNAEIGEIVSPISAGGGFTRTGIFTIVDMNSVELEVRVNESEISKVRIGQAATVTLGAFESEAIDASVSAIIPSADRDRGTVSVRLIFTNRDPRFLPGMSATATLSTAEQ